MKFKNVLKQITEDVHYARAKDTIGQGGDILTVENMEIAKALAAALRVPGTWSLKTINAGGATIHVAYSPGDRLTIFTDRSDFVSDDEDEDFDEDED